MSTVINNLESLFPPFAEQVIKILPQMHALDLYVFETYRSLERQMERFSQGREQRNGVWVVINPKAVVTNAKPGAGFHTYGLAFDGVPDGDQQKAGIQWSWKDTYVDAQGKNQKVRWADYGKLIRASKLEWAGDWKTFVEYPHAQNRYGCQAAELYQILCSEGLEAVWRYIYNKIKVMPNRITVPIQVEFKPVVPAPVITAEDLNSHSAVSKSGIIPNFMAAFNTLIGKNK
jgi:hypothetical protein